MSLPLLPERIAERGFFSRSYERIIGEFLMGGLNSLNQLVGLTFSYVLSHVLLQVSLRLPILQVLPDSQPEDEGSRKRCPSQGPALQRRMEPKSAGTRGGRQCRNLRTNVTPDGGAGRDRLRMRLQE